MKQYDVNEKIVVYKIVWQVEMASYINSFKLSFSILQKLTKIVNMNFLTVWNK